MDSSASPSDFSKFEQYINKFPTNSMDSLKDKYGEYFDFAILRSELSIIYSSTEFHKQQVQELNTHFHV
eukprot:XP_016661901.1 PREDICTED: uncharacterized protein LOC103310099 isoform X3 [Acyrthosiphon pisum]